MPDKAVISHRGEKYEIGRGKRFYGIWAVGAPYDAPVDRWPENHDGWQQAWARFAVIEVPGTIAPVPRERKALPGGVKLPGPLKLRPRRGSGGALLTGEALLVLGVVLGLAGLFPNYEGGQSLLSQWDQVVPHLAYVIGWAVTAGLVALSVARPSNAARLGALFGLGLGVVTFGLFLADIGQLGGGVALGSGLVVSLLGWAACTAGSALALIAHPGQAEPQAQAAPVPAAQAQAAPASAQAWRGQPGPQAQAGQPGEAAPAQVTPVDQYAQAPRPGQYSHDPRPGQFGQAAPQPGQFGWPAQPQGQPGWSAQSSRPVRPALRHAGPLALLVLAAIGTAVAFAPAWDRYTIKSATTGGTQTLTAGNAFDYPATVIAGNVWVMVAIVVVAALAALWRPARHGGWLLAGAIVPLAAEVVSAIIQVGTPPAPETFGVSAAQAAAAGLTFTAGLTGIFWVFLVFVVALLVSCAWLFTEPQHPVRPAFASPWLPAGPERGDAVPGGRAVSAAGDSDEVAASRLDASGEGAPAESRSGAAGRGAGADSGTVTADGEPGTADSGRREDIDSAVRDNGTGPEGEQSAYA